MSASTQRWDEFEPSARKKLDEQFLKELETWPEPGLTEEGIQAYLQYRHDHPTEAITTYEEGQIRKMLHRYVDPTTIPDPVEQEEHTDPVERFGAERLHLTNSATYVAVMLVLTIGILLVFLAFLMT